MKNKFLRFRTPFMTTILVVALSTSSFAMGPKRGKKKEVDQKKREAQKSNQNARAREATAAATLSSSSLEKRGTVFSPEVQTKKDVAVSTSSSAPDVLTPTTDRMRVDAVAVNQEDGVVSELSMTIKQELIIDDAVVQGKAALNNLEGLGKKQLSLEAFVAVLHEDLERWKSEESEKRSLVPRRAIEVAEQLFQQYSSLGKGGANNESPRDEQQSELDSQLDPSDAMKLLQSDQKYYQALKEMIEKASQFRINGNIAEAESCDEVANKIISLFKLSELDNSDSEIASLISQLNGFFTESGGFSGVLAASSKDQGQKEIKFCAEDLRSLRAAQAAEGEKATERVELSTLFRAEASAEELAPATKAADKLTFPPLTAVNDGTTSRGNSSPLLELPFELSTELLDGKRKGQLSLSEAPNAEMAGPVLSKSTSGSSSFDDRKFSLAKTLKNSSFGLSGNKSRAASFGGISAAFTGSIPESPLALLPSLRKGIADASSKDDQRIGTSPHLSLFNVNSVDHERSLLTDASKTAQMEILIAGGVQDLINSRSRSWINARSLAGSAVIISASSAVLFCLYEWYLHHSPSTTSS